MYTGVIGILVFIGINAYAAKQKNIKLALAATICVCVFVFYVSQIRVIKIEGHQVRVESKLGGYATFEKSMDQEEQVYMLVGPTVRLSGARGYSTNLPVIPIGTVDQLNKEFGDFRKCGSPGAQSAMSSMVELRLVGAQKSDLNRIDEAFSKAMQTGEDIFVRIAGHQLTLIEDKLHRGRIRDRDPSSFPPRKVLLVSQLEYFAKSSKSK